MASKIINLRQARKSKARNQKRAQADANAVRHGLTKSERATTAEEKTRARRLLDGHEIADDTGDAE